MPKWQAPTYRRHCLRISAELDSAEIIERYQERFRAAIGGMLRTAPELAAVPEAVLRLKAETLGSVMAGAVRAVLEGGAAPSAVQALRGELVLLGRGYLEQ